MKAPAMANAITFAAPSTRGVPCVVYASHEVHNSVDKAIGMMGLGRRNLRRIETDDEYRIVPAALERAIAEDRAAGRRPACIIGTAGTVNTEFRKEKKLHGGTGSTGRNRALRHR